MEDFRTVRLRSSDGLGGADLSLSGDETGFAERREKQLIEERPKLVLGTPSLNDHEPTTVRVPDVQHEPIGWTAVVCTRGDCCADPHRAGGTK